MASKLSGRTRDVYLCALFGVLVYVTYNTCFHGPIDDNLPNSSVKRQGMDIHVGIAARSVSDGFRALAIQFLHFFLAKWLQFRYLMVQPQQSTSFMPLPFWLTFMRSISNHTF